MQTMKKKRKKYIIKSANNDAYEKKFKPKNRLRACGVRAYMTTLGTCENNQCFHDFLKRKKVDYRTKHKKKGKRKEKGVAV